VLNAPTSRPVFISEQSGRPRRERRRTLVFVDKSGDVDEVRAIPVRGVVPKAQQLPATNVPFTWSDKEAAERAIAAMSGVMAAETRRTMAQRVKSLMTFGAGRRTKEQAQTPVVSHKSRGILGRGRAGAR
jgi:hypothetical protein